MGYKGKKVLVVADSVVIRQIIKKNLKELGFSEPVTVDNVNKGLAHINLYTEEFIFN